MSCSLKVERLGENSWKLLEDFLVLPKGYSVNVDGDVVKNIDLNKSNEESYKRNILNKKLSQETSLGNIFKQQGE